jgi:hypothetical protein
VVDVTALDSADPGLLVKSSADWYNLGLDIRGAGDQISSDVGAMISGDAWTGAAATAAQKKVGAAFSAFEAAQGEVNAVSDVLEGLAEAMAVCQQTLREAQELASKNGLTISADGTVAVSYLSLLPGSLASPVSDLLDSATSQVQALVRQALQRATEADKAAAAELRTLASHAGQADPDVAFGDNAHPHGDGLTASRLELQLIYDSIPAGPPSLVARWWAGLTPAQQAMLKDAAPGQLGTLAGIPASVKAELAGSTGLNRVAVVNYALQNTFNGKDDVDGDNCTNFVSDALLAGGMTQKGTFPFSRSDLNDWYKATDPLPFFKGSTRTYTWADASDLHAFLTHNGSDEVPYGAAQPGDVAFYRNDNQGIYHAAVVTAVVNGQVFYSQHTPGEQNADWGSRQYMPQNSAAGGPTNVIVVKPGADIPPPSVHPDPMPDPPQTPPASGSASPDPEPGPPTTQ